MEPRERASTRFRRLMEERPQKYAGTVGHLPGAKA